MQAFALSFLEEYTYEMQMCVYVDVCTCIIIIFHKLQKGIE